MLKNIGVDICENYRIEKLYNKYKDRFLKKIFFPEEIAYCLSRKNPIPHLSARYALKESFVKSLCQKRDMSISYKEVGIVGTVGKKELVVKGRLKELLKKKNIKNITFSISHAKEYSVAFLILES